MTRLIRNSLYTSTSFVRFGIVALAIVGYLAAAPHSASATTFTVNSTVDAPDAIPGDGICDDGTGNCTLRAAINESDFSGGANVINVPAGTFILTGPADDEFNGGGATLESGDLDIVDLSAFALPQLTSVTINGAGAGVTIIDGGGNDRVFDINNFVAFGTSVDVTLAGLTIRNGNAPVSSGFNESGGGIQFDGFNNQTSVPAGTLTISNCNVTGNTAAGQGGGILAVFGSLSMSGSVVSGNSSVNAAGGGISYDGSSFPGLRTLQITTSRISGNHANNGIFGSGGGVFEGGNANKTIDHSVITSNTAGTQGGGVANNSGDLLLNFNVIVGNTASGNPASSGFRSNTGSVNADNNWWGCNQGPALAPCDRASGVTSIAAWLQLSHTASPNTILVNQATTLQADFFTNNLNTGILAADLVALNGRAVVFNNAVLGTISGADPTINAGKANATFTAGAVSGSGSADATVDSATVTAFITINPAPVAPTITTNPTNQTVCNNGTATFTAAADGFPTPTVQWQVSSGGPFTDISGATNTTLMFTATLADNGKQYRAVFTNTAGTATTTAATLTVVVTTTTDPADQSVCQGSTATFSTTASGIGPFSFVWKKGATILNNGDLGGRVTITSGSNTSTLMISNVQASDAGTYSVETTGNCGTATQSASLTLDSTPPSITCPANITVEATCPSGAIATYTAPVGTDNCPGATTVRTAGPASGSIFPIGNTTVTYTTTDSSGNSTSCSFTVTVLTPQAVLQNLIASVNASSLNGTQKNGLLAKLNAALTAINNGQTNVACNKLSDFINSVGTLVSHGDITAAQGQAWINSANHVRNVIGCTNLGCT